MNKAILIGNLTADPEVRTTGTGISVTSFTVAVNRNFTNQQGEREADFIRCVTFRKLAENVGRYLRKGSKVAVEGRIQTGSYEAQDGSRRYTTEIICDSVQFLDTRNQQDSGYGAGVDSNYGGGYNQQYQSQNQNQNQNRTQNQPSYQQNQNQGYNNPMNQGYNNQRNEQNQDDFFDNDSDIDISEDDLPF